MKKIDAIVCSIWLCTGISDRASAQNLVLNPSFENVNLGNLKCSWYLDNTEFTSAISNWDMPMARSTDIFHSSVATSCFCSPYPIDPYAVGSRHVQASPAGMNYSWSGPGIVSGGSSANPVANQPGTYNLTVTNLF